MNNIQFNEGDLVDHHCISAIIYNDDKTHFVQLYHNKLGMWTVPVGKCDDGSTPEDTLRRELFEEVDIVVNSYTEIGTFTKTYIRGTVPVVVTNHVFLVCNYFGTVSNKEPNKHMILKWITPNQLHSMVTTDKVSDSSKFVSNWLKNQ